MRNIIKSAVTISLMTSGSTLLGTERPNILWLTSEDNNTSWISCYGSKNVQTPNIDGLAAEGFQYMNCYANAPVCAPSRSTWITGVNALSMGTHPMRSRYKIPHDTIKYYPDFLKEAGYYVSNDGKTDYNIGGRNDKEVWDSEKVDWNTLKQKQPFFQVINSGASHESKAQGSVENTKHSPADMHLRKYHPDIQRIRKNYAKYADAISKMDNDIGKALSDLEKSGLAENTIVIYNSDHGGVLPRSKRFLFDSGLHSPFIIRIPKKFRDLCPAKKPGVKIDRLVSFIDMPKTWLSITGAKVPSYMQGSIILGPEQEKEQQFHYAFRGRMDERPDNVRAVHDKRFLYIKNYMPYVPWGQRLNYLWKMEATQAWDEHHTSGQTDAVTGRFFTIKPVEELYDSVSDPDNINNLINNPEYTRVVKRMRAGLRNWQQTIFDAGLLPESDMVKRAADNNMTIYELVRNSELYNLNGYLDAADIALEKNEKNLDRLTTMLSDQDAGIRYWGIVGCLMISEKALPIQNKIEQLLADDSHVVRALAAWTLCKQGKNVKSLATLKDLVKHNSYALHEVINILDHMEEMARPAAVQLLQMRTNDKKIAVIQNHILIKLGYEIPAELKANIAKTKKKKKSNKRKSKI